MLKLLLKEESKKIKREYISRFFILILLGFSVSLILFLISLLPAFVLIKADQKVLNEELKVAQNEELNSDRVKLKEKLNDLKSLLNILDVKQYEISYLIQKVTERQTRSISISSFSFDANYLSENSTFTIQGNANNRESLADFVSELQKVDEFKTASLPFSSFAKDSEIPFSITIKLPSLIKT